MIAKYDSRAFVLRKQAYRVDADVSELHSGREKTMICFCPHSQFRVGTIDHQPRSPFFSSVPPRVNKQPTQGAAHAATRAFQHTPVRRRAVLTD